MCKIIKLIKHIAHKMNGYRYKYGFFIICAFAFLFQGQGQGYVFTDGRDVSKKIRFELINNLVVVPLQVNGTRLNFILDSGVSQPILFNLSDLDSVALRNVSAIKLQGLGTGEPIDALRSVGNTFRLGSLVNPNQDVYVVLDKGMNFSPSLGHTVHGIVGYDVFRNHAVEIHYGRKFLRFYKPGASKTPSRRHSVTLPLELRQNKAFLEAAVVVEGAEEVPVRLLLDTGSGDAVWLFKDEANGLPVPETYYEEFLGQGLSGVIYGKRTRVKQVRIGSHILENAKAAFPDMESFQGLTDLADRNGSVGGAILKRFNLFLDYPSGKITFTRNNHFSDPFHYNLAGLEVQHAGMRYISERITDSRGMVKQDEDTFGNVQIRLQHTTQLSLVPEIVVSAIRAGSPADEVGLKEGDVILAVNGKPVHRYALQEIVQMINERKGKRVRLKIERMKSDLVFSFVLKELFK